jgi:undecaprenyl-diphosphatase
MDLWLLHEINGLANRSSLLDRIAIDWAMLSPLILGLAVSGTWFVLPGRSVGAFPRRTAVVAIGAALLALAIAQVIGHAWFRERPFDAHQSLLLVAPSHDPSFPSDHAVGAFALATPFVLVRGARRYGALLLLGALALAVDRVYIGQHYPSDVAGGAVIGAASAWAVCAIAGWVDRAAPLLWWPLDWASRVTDQALGRLHPA